VSDDRSSEVASPDTTDVGDGTRPEPIRIEMDKRVDLVLSLLWVAFGVATVYFAAGFRVGGYPDPVTARGLPYFTGTYLVIAGLVLAARRVVTWSHIPGKYAVSEGQEDEPGHPSSWVRSFLIIAVAAIWAYSLGFLGFVLATPLMLFAMLWLMAVRSWTKLVLFPLLFSFLSWLVFSQVLGVILPMGILAPWARRWGLMP
jgi:hypothetical protein